LIAPRNVTVDTETVTVNGNGTYATPVGFTVPTGASAGTYSWHVTYSGNSNNNAVIANLENVPPPPPVPNTRDIFWHDASGANLVWALNQSEQIIAGPNLPTVPASWSITGIGDFNKDGISDLLWRDASGANQIWNMDITEQIGNGANLPTVPNSWS